MITYDGFEAAFVGTVTRNTMERVACYDVDKMIQVLVDRDGMEYDDAVEFLEFNVFCMWVGDETPVLLVPCTLDDAIEFAA